MTHTRSCFTQLHLGKLLVSIAIHRSFKFSVAVSYRWEFQYGERVSAGEEEFKRVLVLEHLLTLETVWSIFESDVVELKLWKCV